MVKTSDNIEYSRTISINYQARRYGITLTLGRLGILDTYKIAEAIVHAKIGIDVPDKAKVTRLLRRYFNDPSLTIRDFVP